MDRSQLINVKIISCLMFVSMVYMGIFLFTLHPPPYLSNSSWAGPESIDNDTNIFTMFFTEEIIAPQKKYLIVISAWSIMWALIGFLGVFLDNPYIMYVTALALFIHLHLLLVAEIYIDLLKVREEKNIYFFLAGAMENITVNEENGELSGEFSGAIDFIQQRYHCCGLSGIEEKDRNVSMFLEAYVQTFNFEANPFKINSLNTNSSLISEKFNQTIAGFRFSNIEQVKPIARMLESGDEKKVLGFSCCNRSQANDFAECKSKKAYYPYGCFYYTVYQLKIYIQKVSDVLSNLAFIVIVGLFTCLQCGKLIEYKDRELANLRRISLQLDEDGKPKLDKV